MEFVFRAPLTAPPLQSRSLRNCTCRLRGLRICAKINMSSTELCPSVPVATNRAAANFPRRLRTGEGSARTRKDRRVREPFEGPSLDLHSDLSFICTSRQVRRPGGLFSGEDSRKVLDMLQISRLRTSARYLKMRRSLAKTKRHGGLRESETILTRSARFGRIPNRITIQSFGRVFASARKSQNPRGCSP